MLQLSKHKSEDVMSSSSSSTYSSSTYSSSTYSTKSLILIAICLQNAGYTLLRKYSVQTEAVSSKEILLVSELIKIVVSIYLVLKGDDVSDAQGQGIDRLIWLIKHSGKILVLALIYGVMNILSFVALQYIGAGEFTICAQVRIYINIFRYCMCILIWMFIFFAIQCCSSYLSILSILSIYLPIYLSILSIYLPIYLSI